MATKRTAKGEKKAPSGTATRHGALDNCVLPPALPHEALPDLVLARDRESEDAIREYMASQAPDERVTHAEPVASEHVLGRTIGAWDVLTDKGHWWVLTEPTNLYSYDLFPSLDYVMSFHVGLTARVLSRPNAGVEVAERQILAAAWRRWEQAAELIGNAAEAEDMQSIGMRCRESLITMAKTTAKAYMVPLGAEAPKAADVVHWCELIADHIAHGGSADNVRGYLKSASKAGWQLVNWLTHTSNATRADAILAVDITKHILATFGTALFRHSRGIPDRCPTCGSYKIGLRLVSDAEPNGRPACRACGWYSGSQVAKQGE